MSTKDNKYNSRDVDVKVSVCFEIIYAIIYILNNNDYSRRSNPLNPLVKELNETLQKESPAIYDMLSDLGKSLFYPKGILSQSAEAGKLAYKFNATIGIATENGIPMHFDHIQEGLSAYDPKDIYPYAPPAGKEALRVEWKKKIKKDNPSLEGKQISMPMVTNALTHGLSIAADLFVEQGDTVVLPDKYWGNYNFIFGVRRQSNVATYPLFNEQNEYNVKGLEEVVMKQGKKVIVLLNFPNNPTGYTPGEAEVKEIVAVLERAAQAGKNIIALIDDAYFNLFYGDSIKESIFSKLVNVHERILPIKIDGATKENYVWGFRVGFITYGLPNLDTLTVLEQKTKGLIRGTVSSCSHPSQTFVLEAMQSPEYDKQQAIKCDIMKRRALKVKDIVENNEKFNEVWTPYPFNSGYFMCIKLKDIHADELRLNLLNNCGVGTIAINNTDLRIAFSCVRRAKS